MQKIKKDILSELVYENMEKMLLNGDILLGQKVNKREIAEIIGVSQTPINDVFNRLSREGILVQNSRSEYFVREFSKKDMIELFEVRAGLEGAAIRIWAERISEKEIEEVQNLFHDIRFPLDAEGTKTYESLDQSFHQKILESIKDRLLGKLVSNYELVLKCYRKGLIRPPEETYKEHVNIIEALSERDPRMAQQFLTDHHFATRDFLLGKTF